MTTPYWFQVALLLTTLLCTLVAGFVFAFSVVVMPGIQRLRDGEFLMAFKVMDGVIQDNQPVFMLVWVGSIIAVVVSLVPGAIYLHGLNWYLLLAAALAWLLGVQLPTFRFNIPLNNRLQSLDLPAINDSELARARQEFEPAWNHWNRFRTIIACSSVTLLLALLIGL